MILQARGKQYEIIKGSDVLRDGVYVELSDITDKDNRKYLLEIFHSDANGTELFSSEKMEIPYNILLETIKLAEKWLDPE